MVNHCGEQLFNLAMDKVTAKKIKLLSKPDRTKARAFCSELDGSLIFVVLHKINGSFKVVFPQSVGGQPIDWEIARKRFGFEIEDRPQESTGVKPHIKPDDQVVVRSNILDKIDNLIDWYIDKEWDSSRPIDLEIEKPSDPNLLGDLEVINGEDVKKKPANPEGQGRSADVESRKAIELYAMERSANWLTKNGYECDDTSSGNPYDFLASKDGKELYVEVKGTQQGPDAITMTHNEVDLHRTKKGSTALFIVHDIKLEFENDKPKCSGGIELPDIGWDIDEWDAKPTQFRLKRKKKYDAEH